MQGTLHVKEAETFALENSNTVLCSIIFLMSVQNLGVYMLILMAHVNISIQ